MIGNIIEQSKTTENPNIISFGAEGYKHPANELYLINNTLVDKRVEGGFFLAVRPGFNVVKAYNNLLLGKRPLNTGGIDGEFINNPNVERKPSSSPTGTITGSSAKARCTGAIARPVRPMAFHSHPIGSMCTGHPRAS